MDGRLDAGESIARGSRLKSKKLSLRWARQEPVRQEGKGDAIKDAEWSNGPETSNADPYEDILKSGSPYHGLPNSQRDLDSHCYLNPKRSKYGA